MWWYFSFSLNRPKHAYRIKEDIKVQSCCSRSDGLLLGLDAYLTRGHHYCTSGIHECFHNDKGLSLDPQLWTTLSRAHSTCSSQVRQAEAKKALALRTCIPCGLHPEHYSKRCLQYLRTRALGSTAFQIQWLHHMAHGFAQVLACRTIHPCSNKEVWTMTIFTSCPRTFSSFLLSFPNFHMTLWTSFVGKREGLKKRKDYYVSWPFEAICPFRIRIFVPLDISNNRQRFIGFFQYPTGIERTSSIFPHVPTMLVFSTVINNGNECRSDWEVTQ